MTHKRTFVTMIIAAALMLASTGIASANDFHRGGANDNPFRLMAYPFHAVGTAAEWVIARPIHWLVSRPNARIIFGHTVHPTDVYFAWEDYR